jgi:hypothetical protein
MSSTAFLLSPQAEGRPDGSDDRFLRGEPDKESQGSALSVTDADVLERDTGNRAIFMTYAGDLGRRGGVRLLRQAATPVAADSVAVCTSLGTPSHRGSALSGTAGPAPGR